jgi:hypothetical protein
MLTAAGGSLQMMIPMKLMPYNVAIKPTITSGFKIIVRDGCVTHAESNLEYQQKQLRGSTMIVQTWT